MWERCESRWACFLSCEHTIAGPTSGSPKNESISVLPGWPKNLRSASKEMLVINRERALKAVGDDHQEKILVL